MRSKNAIVKFDRPRAPRKHSCMEHRLAASLVAYVSEDDMGLPRDQFLRNVIDRMVTDLISPLSRA